MVGVKEIYKCEVCGNIVEILTVGGGTLVCCGQDMTLLKAQTADKTKEKHVPAIEKTSTGVIVKVGANMAHPMEEKHHIEWIQILADGIAYRKFLKPGDKPEAEFCVKADKIEAREHCNIHGLWKS
ncbi:MAG: desulfoferrodoxin [Candidatus Lokiarchaeota archaeon]|nr:desulfoferrodoxin [Candidatus Lokiarchaeota archaeon]